MPVYFPDDLLRRERRLSQGRALRFADLLVPPLPTRLDRGNASDRPARRRAGDLLKIGMPQDDLGHRQQEHARRIDRSAVSEHSGMIVLVMRGEEHRMTVDHRSARDAGDARRLIEHPSRRTLA